MPSDFFSSRFIAFLFLLALVPLFAWEFTDSLEGWETGTTSEAEAELHQAAGELRGSFIGSEPHLDSPPLHIAVNAETVIVLRLMVQAFSTSGKILIEANNHIPVPSEPFLSPLTPVDFTVVPDGNFHTVYVPIGQHFAGVMTRFRIFPSIAMEEASVGIGQVFAVDWIRISIAPTIKKVEGCINQYFPTAEMKPSDAVSNVRERKRLINGVLNTSWTDFAPLPDLPFSSTYNCLRRGGQRLTITGLNFGRSGATVYVGQRRCLDVIHTVPEIEVQCVSPPGDGIDLSVSLHHGRMPGLIDAKALLSYAARAAAPQSVFLSNIAARSLDVNWSPPSPYWEALAVTGYKVECTRDPLGLQPWTFSVVVGNVTTTTIIGLEPSTFYACAVAALVEDQFLSTEWKSVDLYGRRKLVLDGVAGQFSVYTPQVKTLAQDISFSSFSAALLLSSGPSLLPSTAGPTGQEGSEGHYGLTVVGDANVQNCNASFSCCDSFSSLGGVVTCGKVCHVAGSGAPHSTSFSSLNILTNYLIPGNSLSIRIEDYDSQVHSPSQECGPALRLTSNIARSAGSAWYPRQMNVREGFDTVFKFRISNPSMHCKFMDDVYTHCRSRGGDGFAFILQNESPTALGEHGKELGYGGINNSIAIEFDTWFNYDQLDLYENHISVQAPGFRRVTTANHTYSIGETTRIPELTEGTHTARIRYTPVFDETSLETVAFQSSAGSAYFFENGDFPFAGQPDWGTHLGTLHIYVDDLMTPVLSIAMNVDATLALNHGRAWVGFTAGTGDEDYQTHDILSWDFQSLRMDPSSFPPPVINGFGPYSCENRETCVHP